MVLLTAAAILCFAANSIFCRLALATDLIDPATFTTVRILSAAAMLTAGVLLRHRRFPHWKQARPGSVAAVFVYLVFFSFAYTRMGAATGALVLIAAVQLSMFCIALLQGERFAPLSWLGFAVAAAGVLYLLLPSATAPDPLGPVSWPFRAPPGGSLPSWREAPIIQRRQTPPTCWAAWCLPFS